MRHPTGNAPTLVTGFEPFAGDTTNPSGDIARALHGRVIAGRPVIGATLPCVFETSARELRALLSREKPALVICLGLAGGRTAITPERIAINIDDAPLDDNAGARPTDRPVIRGGPAAYWSTLPVKAIVAVLAARGAPAALSQTAGTFVCNHVFYALMHALRRRPGVRGGFIHLPYATENAPPGKFSVPFETQLAAIEATVEAAWKTTDDTHAVGGTIH